MKVWIVRNYSILLLAFIFILSSCNNDNASVGLLKNAQKKAENMPTEALCLLDSINHPQKMESDYYMQYIVTRVQAKYRSYQDISNDTLIFEAERYFGDRNTDKAAITHFYSGNVHYERNDKEKALNCYLNAELRAQRSTDNYLLKGKIENNIGYLYYEQNLVDSAICRYKKALHYFDQNADIDNLKLNVFNSIGTAYYAKEQLDSAFCYYNKGLILSTKADIASSEALFKQQLGMVYREKGDFKLSKLLLNSSLANTNNTEDSLRVYLNTAKVYNMEHKPDSATLYVDLIKNRLDEVSYDPTKASMLMALAEYNMQCGNYEQAIQYSKQQSEVKQRIEALNNQSKLLEIEKNYSLELKEKQVQQLRMRSYLFILIIVVLVLVIAFVIYYYKQKRNRELTKLRLIEADKTITDTQNRLSRAKEIIISYEIKISKTNYKELGFRVDDLMFIFKIHKTINRKWKNFDCKVKTLAREIGAREKPKLFMEIEEFIKTLEESANEQLLVRINDFLKYMPLNDETVSKLGNEDLMLLISCYCKYPKQEMAKTINVSENELNNLVTDLKDKLREIKVPTPIIRQIFNQKIVYRTLPTSE